MEPLQAASALEQSQLLEPLIFLLLLLDMLADHRFIAAHRRDPVAPGPEMLPYEIPASPGVGPRDVDRALAFHEPITCATEYFGGIDSIVTDRRQVRFWCGTAAPNLKRLTRSYEWLGKDARDVFPLQFESDVELVGGPARGSLPGFLVLENFETRKTRTIV